MFLSYQRRRLSHASIFLALPPEPLRPFRVFLGMRIREENCNMILLAVVTSVQRGIAGGASAGDAADNKPVRLADRTTGRVEQAPSPDKRIIYVSDQPPVRVVGAPFVPNTNPRER